MNSTWKNVFTFMGVVGLFASSTLFADQNDRPKPPSPHSGPPPAGIIDETGKPAQPITPDAGPRVRGGADVYVDADFIFWTPRMDGLAYSYTGFGNDINSVSQGAVQELQWPWEPGFKIGVGLALDHDGWDVGAQYTWLQADRKDNQGLNATLAPTWNINEQFSDYTPNTANGMTSIRTAGVSWKLSYNVANMELGRNFFVSKFLTMRPFWGLTGAWINQKYKVTYTSPDDVSSIDAISNQMSNNQDYWGLGLRTGLDTSWRFTNDFSFYGDFSFSGLWSYFSTTRRDQDKNLVSGATPIVNIDTDSAFHTVKPLFEMEFGFRYETWLSEEEYHLMLQAGWSEVIWSNFNQLFRLSNIGSNGDLTLQGVSVKARFDF